MPQLPPTSTPKRLRTGEALLAAGLVTHEQIEKALAEQKSTGLLLGELLVDQGVINAPTLVGVLGRNLGFPGVHIRHGLVDPPLLKLVGEAEAERLLAVPLFKVRGTLTVAMAEPQSLPAVDRCGEHCLSECGRAEEDVVKREPGGFVVFLAADA